VVYWVRKILRRKFESFDSFFVLSIFLFFFCLCHVNDQLFSLCRLFSSRDKEIGEGRLNVQPDSLPSPISLSQCILLTRSSRIRHLCFVRVALAECCTAFIFTPWFRLTGSGWPAAPGNELEWASLSSYTFTSFTSGAQYLAKWLQFRNRSKREAWGWPWKMAFFRTRALARRTLQCLSQRTVGRSGV